MRGVSKHTKRKWWYRRIRSMNWFSFHYWWFVWLAFIGAIVLFFYLCCDQENNNCNSKSVHDGLERIERSLNDCCDCEEPLPFPPEEPLEDSISNSYGCDSETRSGEAGVTINKHALGNRSGVVRIDFDMDNVIDKLEVFHNERLVASTFDVQNNDNGFVGGNIASGCCGSISFNYSAIGDNFCVVRVTGLDRTSWTYSLSCPY